MNRRDLFKRLTGGLAAAGLPVAAVEAIDAPVDARSTLIIFRSTKHLRPEDMANIKEYWRQATVGTDWADVRAVVLDESLSIEVQRVARVNF